MREYPYLEMVEEGIKYLDRAYPGWLAKVDNAYLDMDSLILHVLAQVTGSLVYETDEAITWSQDALVRHGFVPKLVPGWIQRLTAEWQYQIRTRQQEAKQAAQQEHAQDTEREPS